MQGPLEHCQSDALAAKNRAKRPKAPRERNPDLCRATVVSFWSRSMPLSHDGRSILIIARRGLLARMLRMMPIVLGGRRLVNGGHFGSGTTCYDSQAFSTPELQRRSSQGDPDVSPHGEAKRTGGCQCFRAGEVPGCRHCEALAGPVTETSHCGSWLAARPA